MVWCGRGQFAPGTCGQYHRRKTLPYSDFRHGACQTLLGKVSAPFTTPATENEKEPHRWQGGKTEILVPQGVAMEKPLGPLWPKWSAAGVRLSGCHIDLAA